MRALAMAVSLMLIGGTALAQSGGGPSKSKQRPSYGAGQSGIDGYGYSTGNKPTGHYGGGYIRSDGSLMQEGGSAIPGKTQSDGFRGRRVYDPQTGTYRQLPPRR